MVIWTQCVIFKLPRRLHAFTQRVFRSTCGYVYTIPIVLLLRQRQNLLLDDDARYSTSFLLLPLNHKARKKHYLNDLKKVEYSFFSIHTYHSLCILIYLVILTYAKKSVKFLSKFGNTPRRALDQLTCPVVADAGVRADCRRQRALDSRTRLCSGRDLVLCAFPSGKLNVLKAEKAFE